MCRGGIFKWFSKSSATIISGQGHIGQVSVKPKFFEGFWTFVVETIPRESEVFFHIVFDKIPRTPMYVWYTHRNLYVCISFRWRGRTWVKIWRPWPFSQQTKTTSGKLYPWQILIHMFMQQNQPVVHWRLQLGGVSVHRLASSNSSILIHIGMVNDHWLSPW